MQNFNFTEYLTIGLILLLFGRDYIPAILGKFLGVKMNGNGNGYQAQIDELKEHAKVANEEMGEIKEGIVGLNTKMDIVMRHLNL